jgi:fucose permease
MNWLHACYCFGAMLGPLVMTAVLTGGRTYSLGYLLVGAVLAALVAMFWFTRRQWGQASHSKSQVAAQATVAASLRHPTVQLQTAVFFVYTGLEIAISQWAFTLLTESRGVQPAAAGIAVATYWASIGVGRIVLGMVADRIGIDPLLRACLLVASAGVILFAIPLGLGAAFAGLVLAGIGLAPVFPCLMSRTPQRLGRDLSAHAIGFQVGAAMIGAAAVPATLGVIAGLTNLAAVSLGTVVIAVVLWLLHERLVRRPDVASATDHEDRNRRLAAG